MIRADKAEQQGPTEGSRWEASQVKPPIPGKTQMRGTGTRQETGGFLPGEQNIPREKISKYWHSVFTDTTFSVQGFPMSPWIPIQPHHSWRALLLPSQKVTNLFPYNQTPNTRSKPPIRKIKTKTNTKGTQRKSRQWREKTILNIRNWYP